jgi:hypothetical protein
LNFGYEWYKDGVIIAGHSNYLLGAKESGTYTVKVTSPIGCSNISAPFQVHIHPNPAVNLGNDTAMLPGQTVILNAGAGFNSYLWSTGATTQTINASSATVAVINYWVQVTDNNGCKGGDTILIHFVNNPGLDENQTSPTIRIFPNPSDGLFVLEIQNLSEAQTDLEIYGIDGKSVMKKSLSSSKEVHPLQIDAGHLDNGVYLIQVRNHLGTMVRKIVINR